MSPDRLAQMQLTAWWPILAVLSVACFTDLRSRRIPNWLIVPFLLIGFGRAVWFYGAAGLLESLAGFGVAALICGILWWMRGLGMGDVKLCAALGAWLGASHIFFALILIAISGGVLAVVWALCTGTLGAALSGAGGLLSTIASKGTGAREHYSLSSPNSLKMPYAPAIALGTLLSFFAVPGF